MTESEWLACTDPRRMLDHLLEEDRPPDRKLRLFACACVRDAWGRLADSRSRQAVEVAERFADGRAALGELAEALDAAGSAVWAAKVNEAALESRPERALPFEVAADARSTVQAAEDAAHVLFRDAAWAARWVTVGIWAPAAEQRRQCVLLRDLFGNPFRPVRIDDTWLRFNEGLVPRLARAIYEGRRFEDLPILGDALEEAGCTDPEVLDHCRIPAVHVRGCWLVDCLVNGT